MEQFTEKMWINLKFRYFPAAGGFPEIKSVL